MHTMMPTLQATLEFKRFARRLQLQQAAAQGGDGT